MSFHSDPEMRDDLRKPFSAKEISKLPGTAKRPALDYVSHAAVTNRLNRAAPDWTYSVEPVTVVSGDGTPHVVAVFGTMTIGGVSRQEVGAVDQHSSYGQELKEAISDFIRRGAMRFGVGIDLWAKEELAKPAEPPRTAGSAHEGVGALVPPPASAPSPYVGGGGDASHRGTPGRLESAPSTPSSGDDTTSRGGASPEAEGKLENDNKTADSAPVAPSGVVDAAEGVDLAGEGRTAPEAAATPEQFDRLLRLYEGRVNVIRASGVKKLSELTFGQAEELILAKAGA